MVKKVEKAVEKKVVVEKAVVKKAVKVSVEAAGPRKVRRNAAVMTGRVEGVPFRVVEGWLSRDTLKAGGEIRLFKGRPVLGKEGRWRGRDAYGPDAGPEPYALQMTAESWAEDYAGEAAPEYGTCEAVEMEVI